MQREGSNRREFIRAFARSGGLYAAIRPLVAQAAGNDGKLSSRPQSSSPEAAAAAMAPGLHPLNLRLSRDALLYVPESSKQFKRPPLVVALHGAGTDAERGIEMFRPLADEYGFVLLAPASALRTWDRIDGPYGPDAAFIDRCLKRTFETQTVDARRIAMAGFSDGASYALSLGLRNGGLFEAVLAFSAGFVADEDRAGKPRVFLAHGTLDQVFPIEACGRRILRQLQQEEYLVVYREFEDKHMLPPEVASEALGWFMKLSA